MNKRVTINSNVQRIYVTELCLFYINDITAIVLYCSRAQPADLNLSTLLHHLLLIFSHASDMPHHLKYFLASKTASSAYVMSEVLSIPDCSWE